MSSRPDVGATLGSGRARPVIKEPVWTPEIPLYFYTGGLAGASAGVGLLAELRGETALARRAWVLRSRAASPAPRC